ncbi:MAG: hypothetical protein ACK4IS_13470 [Erythrobacter sp.]
MSDLRASLSRQPCRPARLRRMWLLVAGIVLAVLVLAALDGGERALRPISEEIALPAASEGSGQ